MVLSKREFEIINNTFLFTGMNGTELRELFSCLSCTVTDYDRDEIIFSPECFRKDLGIVLSGKVRVTKGKTGFVVSELAAGELFGAAALFNDEQEYVSTLTARTASRILFLKQEDVQRLMDIYPLIRANYIRYLSARIRFLSSKLDSISCGNGEKKLTAYLLGGMGENGKVFPEYSMTELAGRLNVGRATLYRELQKLEELNVITRKGKTIVVVNPEILKKL